MLTVALFGPAAGPAVLHYEMHPTRIAGMPVYGYGFCGYGPSLMGASCRPRLIISALRGVLAPMAFSFGENYGWSGEQLSPGIYGDAVVADVDRPHDHVRGTL
jgi:hypothetical protein